MNANINNNANGTKTPEQLFSEAPASWNTRYLNPDGFERQITLRGESGSDLLERAASAIAYLLNHVCLPYVYNRSTSRLRRKERNPPKVNLAMSVPRA